MPGETYVCWLASGLLSLPPSLAASGIPSTSTDANIDAVRGSLAVLGARAACRGLELEVRPLGVGVVLGPREEDLLYVGGGQDLGQALIAPELAALGPALREACDPGAAFLAVCG